jgi:pentatricopeptide repeat domain-containing protein 1/leucine-rich PPR motif-containing protein
LFKSGKISFALELVDEMHDRGQPADVITYNSLLHALCKNHQLDKAIAFVNKMKAKVFSQMFAHTIY